MNLFELSLQTVREENKKNPYPTKAEYQQETNKHIEKCRGKTIRSLYGV